MRGDEAGACTRVRRRLLEQRELRRVGQVPGLPEKLTSCERLAGVSVDCSPERPACLQGEEGSACGSFRWAG